MEKWVLMSPAFAKAWGTKKLDMRHKCAVNIPVFTRTVTAYLRQEDEVSLWQTVKILVVQRCRMCSESQRGTWRHDYHGCSRGLVDNTPLTSSHPKFPTRYHRTTAPAEVEDSKILLIQNSKENKYIWKIVTVVFWLVTNLTLNLTRSNCEAHDML